MSVATRTILALLLPQLLLAARLLLPVGRQNI